MLKLQQIINTAMKSALQFATVAFTVYFGILCFLIAAGALTNLIL